MVQLLNNVHSTLKILAGRKRQCMFNVLHKQMHLWKFKLKSNVYNQYYCLCWMGKCLAFWKTGPVIFFGRLSYYLWMVSRWYSWYSVIWLRSLDSVVGLGHEWRWVPWSHPSLLMDSAFSDTSIAYCNFQLSLNRAWYEHGRSKFIAGSERFFAGVIHPVA